MKVFPQHGAPYLGFYTAVYLGIHNYWGPKYALCFVSHLHQHFETKSVSILKENDIVNVIRDVNVVHSVHSELQDDLGSEDGKSPTKGRGSMTL